MTIDGRTAATQLKLMVMIAVVALAGCVNGAVGITGVLDLVPEKATLTTMSSSGNDLLRLPPPKGKIAVAVYQFRDQTGQYRPAPASSFSTSVSQGATSMLISALNSSGWFVTLEREGLQNLLTERKIIRAKLQSAGLSVDDYLPHLLSANVLLEGGILAYESNVRTGGAGAKYFGIGASQQYREDQVTVSLRAVDIRTGQVLHSVLTTKVILSKELSAGVFRFIDFERLLELEAGNSQNEPSQLCAMAAIESALIYLIAEGVEAGSWSLLDNASYADSILAQYNTVRHLSYELD